MSKRSQPGRQRSPQPRAVPAFPLPPAVVRRNYLPSLYEHLSKADADRLDLLLPEFTPPAHRASVARCLQVLYGQGASRDPQRDFRVFRSRVNKAAALAGQPIAFYVEGNKRAPAEQRFCWFTGPDPTAEAVADFMGQSLADTDFSRLVDNPAVATRGSALAAGKQTVRFFVSCDEHDRRLTDGLLDHLRDHMGTSGRFAFDLWRGQKDILVGQDRSAEIDRALRSADFGLILVSSAYLSGSHAGTDLRSFTAPGGKPVIPVVLSTVSDRADLRGLETRHMFRLQPKTGHAAAKSFEECAGSEEKKRFARALFEAIEDRLVDALRSAAAPAGPPDDRRRAAAAARMAGTPVEEPPDFELLAEGFLPDKPELFVESSAVPTRLEGDDIARLSEQQLATATDSAIEMLEDWALDPEAPPYFAVLGEYGIGKTTTLKQLTHRLLERRREAGSGGGIKVGKDAVSDAQRPFVPLPIFIDLKTYSETIREGRVPKLDTLLQEIFDRSWRVPDAPPFTPEDLKRLVREEGALVIFDGLDEKLVHLDDHQARQFLRELWSILPPAHFGRRQRGMGPPARLAGDGQECPSYNVPAKQRDVAAKNSKRQSGSPPAARRPGRMILSCRSHYFKTLREQNAMLSGGHETGVEAGDYRACILLPFAEPQVREYLAADANVGPDRVEAVLELFASVHNLTELSRRPFLLSLITQQIERLEQRRVRGEAVQGVTLYDDLVDEWLNRDDGKHRLVPEDKRRLMEDIAAAMWRDGARQWPWEQVDRWLAARWAADATFRLRYAPGGDAGVKTFALLEEDFRTATFVLRPDTSQEEFRFAHTSLQEYFLARHLLRAVAESRPEDWDLPLPSPETLDFLGQLLAAHRDGGPLARRLAQWLESYRPRISEAAARYWLAAVAGGYPAADPAPLDLHGADLSEWVFGGTAGRPLNLRRANFRGARMVAARFQHADLTQADLTDACAWRAEFHGVRGERLRLSRADLRGSVWRECQLGEPVGGESADWAAAALIRCETEPGRWSQAIGDNAAVSWSGVPPTQPASLPAATSSVTRLARSCGHSGTVTACAWSPDATRILSASVDNTLKVWDARDGRCLLTLQGHQGTVTACTWSPDATRILSASVDNTLRVWDARDGKCLLTLQGHQRTVTACAWSPDATRILSASGDKTLKVWDARDGKRLLTLQGHQHWVRACAWSPDATRILSASEDKTLKVWDARDGKCLLTLQGHQSLVLACAWSPDATRILSASHDNTLKVWDARDGKCLLTLQGHQSTVTACAWSPDATRILSASVDKTLKVWDARDGKCLLTLQGHQSKVTACAWSPDATRILSASDDNTLKVWDARDGKCLLTLQGHQDWVRACVWSPDATRILSASVDKTLKVWDARDGKCLLTLQGHQSYVTACAWSPDATRILSASVDKTLKVWDARDGKCLLTLQGHQSRVTACGWSPDATRILSASVDKTLKVWDARDGKCLLTLQGHQSTVTACGWSPDATRILSASYDNTLKVWDARDGKCLLTLQGHQRTVTACGWSPDATRILSASHDNTLKVWDACDGKCLLTLQGHQSRVTACAWSPDATRILSASDDGTLKTWAAEQGVEELTFIQGPDDQSAVLDLTHNRVLWADTGAWRQLGWQWIDPATDRLRLLPAEHFGPLPGDPPAPVESAVAIAARRS